MFGVLWCGKLQDCGRYLRILVTILIENKQKYEYCINEIRWYNMIVTAPILVHEGGERVGNIFIVFTLHRGKCDCLLHLQMVRWRRVVGN